MVLSLNCTILTELNKVLSLSNSLNGIENTIQLNFNEK